mmetsp:Transcript_2612/g.3031  ORF Transcript_2612/g.3031 Transcript_2612/m.3031 type:complete len:556 (-) Transcript_2612:381-2048(-)
MKKQNRLQQLQQKRSSLSLTRTVSFGCTKSLILISCLGIVLLTRNQYVTPFLAAAVQGSHSTQQKHTLSLSSITESSSTLLSTSSLSSSQSSTSSENKDDETEPPVENSEGSSSSRKNGPLKVLFLSADTGGGHRASAESLASQFVIHYPGTKYDLCDFWTLDGCWPYRTLAPAYKHLSKYPRQWRFLYHLSNMRWYEIMQDIHSSVTCERKIRKRIASYDADVVVSVHPTMNYTPIRSLQNIARDTGKRIPFFTVVTDLGSGHSTWFQPEPEKVFIASDRIRKIAKKRGNVPDESLVESGLPIRHDFAVQNENMGGDRTSDTGKSYQRSMKAQLNLNSDTKTILVMGGGEGVGSLKQIVDSLYCTLTKSGIDASVVVVCGRNEKLKTRLENRDWNKILTRPKKKRRRLLKFLNPFKKKNNEDTESSTSHGNVKVVPLGFVTQMAEYMVAADILVSKAGPGTIAEAAAVGLPVMMTSFLPGQEAGNVDFVVENKFGEFCVKPDIIADGVSNWLKDDVALTQMSKNAIAISHPNAAEEIVLEIGEIAHQWMERNGK